MKFFGKGRDLTEDEIIDKALEHFEGMIQKRTSGDIKQVKCGIYGMDKGRILYSDKTELVLCSGNTVDGRVSATLNINKKSGKVSVLKPLTAFVKG